MSIPSNPECFSSEVSVLSCILQDSRRCLDLAIQAGMTPDHFYNRSNRLLFQCILDLDSGNKPIDAITTTVSLKESGKLDEAGGTSNITSIAISSPTTAHTDYFIGILLEKYKSRRIIEICTQAIQSANSSEDALPQLEQSLFALAAGNCKQENELQDGVKEFLAEVDLRDKGIDSVVGLPISLGTWKRSFGGILPGRYYAIGGRPGAGKSALVEQLTLEVLLQGKRVLFVTRELRRDRVVGRLASKMAEVNLSKFLRNFSNQVERDKLRQSASDLSSKNLFLVNPSHMTGSMLRSLMRRSHRNKPIDLVVIDYAQKLDCEKGMDRFQAISRNSEEISNAINETGIPALVVVQLNRESEKDTRRPRMSDIKESAQIEQDADCIAMLWKEGSDESDDAKEYRRILSVTKNRDGACDIDEKLWFNGPTMTFKDRM